MFDGHGGARPRGGVGVVVVGGLGCVGVVRVGVAVVASHRFIVLHVAAVVGRERGRRAAGARRNRRRHGLFGTSGQRRGQRAQSLLQRTWIAILSERERGSEEPLLEQI